MKAPFLYYGGKGRMIKKLLPLIPQHRVYVEPFCGAASLFFHKKPSPVEVLNDLNGDIVGLFRILRDPGQFSILQRRLQHTLYARAEFERALAILDDPKSCPMDRAWAWFVARNQGTSGVARTVGHWGRAFISHAGMSDTSNKWNMRLAMLPLWHRRLLHAQIDNRDALEVIRYWDSSDTFFYCDPPYAVGTRKAKSVYAHECSDEFHRELVDLLCEIEGQVMLSGYDHEMYRTLESRGYVRREFTTVCYAAGRGRGTGLQGKGSSASKVPRIEVAWIKSRSGGLLW